MEDVCARGLGLPDRMGVDSTTRSGQSNSWFTEALRRTMEGHKGSASTTDQVRFDCLLSGSCRGIVDGEEKVGRGRAIPASKVLPGSRLGNIKTKDVPTSNNKVWTVLLTLR